PKRTARRRRGKRKNWTHRKKHSVKKDVAVASSVEKRSPDAVGIIKSTNDDKREENIERKSEEIVDEAAPVTLGNVTKEMMRNAQLDDPIVRRVIEYLEDGKLPDDADLARYITNKAVHCFVENGC